MRFSRNISVIYSDSFVASLEYFKRLNKLLSSSILITDEKHYRRTDYVTLNHISNGNIFHINDDLPENRVYLFWSISTNIITTDFKRSLKAKNSTVIIFTNNKNWFKLKEFNKIDLEYESRINKITFILDGRTLDDINMSNFIIREFKFNKVLGKQY